MPGARNKEYDIVPRGGGEKKSGWPPKEKRESFDNVGKRKVVLHRGGEKNKASLQPKEGVIDATC